MPVNLGDLIERAKRQAWERWLRSQRQDAELSFNSAVIEPGTQLGPNFAPVIVDRPSVLVFIDPTPRADFSHPCQYLLFEADSGTLYRTVDARWHPYPQGAPPEFTKSRVVGQTADVAAAQPCRERGQDPKLPPIPSSRRRHAVLFGGLADWRHLNEIEFCFRVLHARYSFPLQHIHVLHFDGTLNSRDIRMDDPEDFPFWPGEEEGKYTVDDNKRIVGKGTRKNLQELLKSIGELGRDDLFFLFCTGHGDRSSEGGGQASLTVFDEKDLYFASDLRSDLEVLGAEGSLIVVMQQCHSGGFGDEVLKLGRNGARAVSFAAATLGNDLTDPSDCGRWGRFAISWLAAQRGVDALNQPLLAPPVCTGDDSSVAVAAAFDYANRAGIRLPCDEPLPLYSADRARALTLV